MLDLRRNQFLVFDFFFYLQQLNKVKFSVFSFEAEL